MFDNKCKFIDFIKNMSDEDYGAFIASLANNSVLARYSEATFDPMYDNANYITDFLTNFGFCFGRDGFQYLRTSIGILLHEPEVTGNKLMNLYQEIAKRYGTTWSAAERGMRYSIRRVYEENYHSFDCFNHPWKIPTLGEFLRYSADHLK